MVDRPPQRHDRLDALRGLAIVWMAVFHLCFDLNHFGLIRADFLTDPVWTVQRSAIVALFLFCAGVGQSVALAQGQTWPRFWRRWCQVAGCAVLVSAGSYLMFPRSFIFFGVLHGVAVMLIIVRVSHRAGRWLWPAGLLALLLPWLASHPFFDDRLTAWVGLVTHKPVTEDFVPVLPWLGMMWWGLAAGRWVGLNRPQWLQAGLRPGWGPLATLGRWSLSFYMVHQPVLLGLLSGVIAARSALG